MKGKSILFKCMVVVMTLLLISSSTFSQSLLADGKFSTTTSITPLGAPPVPTYTWCSWKNEATVSSFSATVSGGVCSISFSNSGNNTWDVQLSQYGFPLEFGETYQLTFDVKSDAERDFGVYIGQEAGSWINLNAANYLQHATTNWEKKSIKFVATSVFAMHKLSFDLGAANSKTYFDNILLEKVIIPAKVVIAGTFQNELGCTNGWGGDWEADCNATALTYSSGTGLWTGTFNVPAGCQQYKVTINGSWGLNYGENGEYGSANIQLYVPADGPVTFTYDPESHLVITTPYASGFNPNCTNVVLAGSFQTEAGCANDWDPSCSLTGLTYNSSKDLYEGDITLPAGCYEYKVVHNGDWYVSFGKNGDPNGANYILTIPGAGSQTVHFSYNPYTHVVSSIYNANECAPFAVVVAGSFQQELGCPNDWMPDCNVTSLEFKPEQGYWTDTFNLPAGNWAYRVTMNNSWYNTYGQGGVAYGPDYQISVCSPARVAFVYYPDTHILTANFLANTICVNKFYDANVNGIQDYNEPGLEGVTFTLSGAASGTVTTDANGKAYFSDLPKGEYQLTETMPSGYYATGATSKSFHLEGQYGMEVGNVCLGPGGLRGLGFWMSKNGRDVMMDYGSMEPELQSLRNFYLRNADGSEFDPVTYDQFVNWLKKANAGNMAYMLSAQLAVLYLNYEAGYIKWDSYLYTPGCGSLGEGNFSHWYSLYSQTSYSLWNYGYTPAGDPQRSYQECLKNALDSANNNLSFVQPKPCTEQTIVSNKENADLKVALNVSPVVKLWPNPSGTYFNLQTAGSNEAIQFKVFDVNGSLVYTAKGASDKVYRFGENLKAGVYMVEVLQGNNRTVQKLVKQ